MLENYFDFYELTFINYLFDFILSAFYWSEGCQEYIWFITRTDLWDILFWSNRTIYFPTYDNINICSWLLPLRKVYHCYIYCMLNYISWKSTQKCMGNVIMFHILPLIWLMFEYVHVVLDMCRDRNCTFLLIPTLGYFNHMPELFRKMYSSILSVKISFGCACDFIYTRNIIIVLVQLFCSIFCKHNTCYKHNFDFRSAIFMQTTYLLDSMPIWLEKITLGVWVHLHPHWINLILCYYFNKSSSRWVFNFLVIHLLYWQIDKKRGIVI